MTNTVEENDPLAAPVSNDPFEPHSLQISQFILTARVYDVLLALLKEANPDVARDILELHSAGNIIGTAPSFNGTFLTDLMNSEDFGGTNQNEEESHDGLAD